MNSQGLTRWQQRAYTCVVGSSEQMNLMLIAEGGAGKTYVLNRIQQATSAIIVDGLKDDPKLVREAAERAAVVLLDEAGAFSHYTELKELLVEFPTVQFVVATQPACPPMKLIEPEFEVISPDE